MKDVVDSWADGRGHTRHADLEIQHAAAVRVGRAEALGDRDPVPGCACSKCVLLAMHKLGELELGVVDLLMRNILPDLARRVPAERRAVAERLRQEWVASAMIALPNERLLIELAGRMPGARRAPRPVRDDRDALPIEQARRAPIVDVCGQLGIELKRSGKSWRGSCPFHESESGTSFSVDPERGLFHCFGCGAGGDTIDLFRRARDLRFADAVRELAS